MLPSIYSHSPERDNDLEKACAPSSPRYRLPTYKTHTPKNMPRGANKACMGFKPNFLHPFRSRLRYHRRSSPPPREVTARPLPPRTQYSSMDITTGTNETHLWPSVRR